MPDQKISELAALSAVDDDDLLALVDTSAGETKKATKAALFANPTFTGNVVVPDADADGEAIAYDQAGARLAGLTSTGNVTMASSYNTLNLETVVGLPSRIRWTVDGSGVWTIERQATTGHLAVAQSDLSTGAYQSIPLTLVRSGTTSEVRMTGAASVTVPSPSASTHAARLVRTPSAVTGDLGLPGYAGSDTGWRDITALQVNGWAFTLIELHRSGAHCTLRGVWPITADDAKTSDTFYTLPSGYRSSQLLDMPTRNPSTTGAAGPFIRLNTAGPAQAILTSTVSTVYFSISWVTTDTWPTSLPGTQVSAPASW